MNFTPQGELQEDPQIVAARWLSDFASAFADGEPGLAVAQTFVVDGWLRDSLTFTWDARSLSGRTAISNYVATALLSPIHRTTPSEFELDLNYHLLPAVLDVASGTHGAVHLAFTFSIGSSFGRGTARVIKDEDGELRALCAFMMLDGFHGHAEVEAELGLYDGQRLSWEDLARQRQEMVEADPYAVIGTSRISRGETYVDRSSRCWSDWFADCRAIQAIRNTYYSSGARASRRRSMARSIQNTFHQHHQATAYPYV